MMKVCAFSCLSAVAIILCVASVSAKQCTSIADCQCGYQCIDTERKVQCDGTTVCRCRLGCGVGNMFIKPGKLWQKAYCNLCSCHDDPSVMRGIPVCTRSRWCGMPEDQPVYPVNPNCPVSSRTPR